MRGTSSRGGSGKTTFAATSAGDAGRTGSGDEAALVARKGHAGDLRVLAVRLVKLQFRHDDLLCAAENLYSKRWQAEGGEEAVERGRTGAAKDKGSEGCPPN